MKIDGAAGCAYQSLEQLLSFSARGADASDIVNRLVAKYSRIEHAMAADLEELTGIVGKDGAMLLKVAAAVISRRATDRFDFGAVHNVDEVCEYFKAVFLGVAVERVYAMSFDGQDRALSCDLIGEGTVNSSEIWPRKILESAIRAGASSVMLAHNHPRGLAKPSRDDIVETASLYNTLACAGINLKGHVVVAERDAVVLHSGMDYEILK